MLRLKEGGMWAAGISRGSMASRIQQKDRSPRLN